MKNFNNKSVPYNFGVVLFFWITLDYVRPTAIELQAVDYWFLLSIWLIGWMDDQFGTSFPKGITGHFRYCFNERKMTTGFIKAFGGVILSFLYLLLLLKSGEISFSEATILSSLLILLPHVLNLLDTRPLRVMKVGALIYFVILFQLQGGLLVVPGLLILFLLWFKEEVRERTMLGDNGAMVFGAYLAVLARYLDGNSIVITLVTICVLLTILAEKYSISRIVAKTKLLRAIDLFGQRKET
ncbi:hypothetical protein [Alteribacter populi]|uniref:hypothetical protein n=1 Tax=Alteribacter populi TaxID=2011011 RepID=UPI0012FD005C|nr:hypothetical protein [Alteribacter populi]